MACLNCSAFINILIVLFSLFSGVVFQDTDADYFTKIQSETDYRCSSIPDNYVNKLSNAKPWVDPYEIHFAPNVNEELVMSSPQYPDMASHPPILDDDDQPYFSDIRGDVIKKAHTTYERTTSNDFNIEGSFPKGRQQICVLDSIYISRWLKKLIFKIENESDLEPSALSFPLDSVILDNLKELSTAKSLEITQLDNLICNMISQTVITRKEARDWTVLCGYCIDIVWVIVYVTSLGLATYAFHYSFKQHPRIMLVFCGAIICIFWHWLQLYQRIKAYKHAELSSVTIPDQCKKHDFELFEHVQDYVKSYFISNECDTYYETLPVNPLLEASFVVVVSEATNLFLFHPLSTSSHVVNWVIKQIFNDLSVNILLFLMMIIFLIIIMIRNYRQVYKVLFPESHSTLRSYVGNVYANVTLSLRDSVYKTSSSIQRASVGETVEHDSDAYADHSDSLRCQGNKSNYDYFSSIVTNTVPRSRNVPENHCSSGFCCESCQTLEQSLTEDDDDNSDAYSDNSSCSGSSDSQDCCPCCVVSEEMLQELHVGCRVCENNSAAVGDAGSSRDIPESVSKRSDVLVSGDDQNSQKAHSDHSMLTYQRIYEHSSDLDREEIRLADSGDCLSRQKVDPSAG